MQGKQVRDVTMPGVWLVIVFEPFLQLSVFANLEWREAVTRGHQPGAKLSINVEQLARFDDPAQKRLSNLRVHRRSHAELGDGAIRQAIAILRRQRWPGNQLTFAI